jgi:hypothetical protein
MSAPPDANANADDGFDPNALLQRFGERLRELDQPVDLSISLGALQSRRAQPTARGRWNMDDVTDVEDQSERRQAVEAETRRLREQAEGQALAAQQRAEQETAALKLAAERAAALEAARRAQAEAEAKAVAQALASELRRDVTRPLPFEAPALDLASIAMPRMPAEAAPGLPELQLPARADTPALDLSELSSLFSRVAQGAAARAEPPAAQDLTLRTGGQSG